MKCEISIRLGLDKFVGIVLFIENGAGDGGRVQKIRKWFQPPRKPGITSCLTKLSLQQNICQDDEYESRLGISTSEGFKRLEIESNCIQDDLPGQAKTKPRLTCLKNIPPYSSLHVVNTGSFQQRSECVSIQLA